MGFLNLPDIAFFGFALYSFFFIIFKRFAFYKNRPVLKKIDQAAITVVSFAGLVYVCIWMYQIGVAYFGEGREGFIRRATGRYALGYWLQPLLYLLFSQLLWIPKMANNGFFRLLAALFLFFNFEKFVIMVTSIHRDYLPSSWTMYYGGYSFLGWVLLDWLIKMIIFSALVTLAYYLRNRKML